ncbi:hypothetical protein MTO96_038704 [Rhipicephalus appendiculatus]
MGEVNPAFNDDTCVDTTETEYPVSLGSNSSPHGGRADSSNQRSASLFSEKTPWKKRLPFFAKVAVVLLFHAYLAAGISLTWSSTPDYCHDVKFLTVITAIGYIYVLWCVFLLGLAVLRWSHGRDALQCLSNKVKNFLDYTNSGSHFVFGHLASGWNLTEALGDLVPKEDMLQNVTNVTNITTVPIVDTIKSLPAVFLFQALPVIFFFSFFVNILYFYGIMQRLVLIVGSFLQFTIGTTVCESMTAAANIFLGMTEAPLVVRPFLSKMTKSELHTVMTGGFATIAGSVMAAYIHFGVSPAHLMTASIMSAPAALAYSKLLYPETEESQTQRDNIEMPRSEERNVLEAASNGTNVALAMIGSIVANLVGFLAFIAFLNSTLQWFGSIVTLDFLTFEWLLAKIFTPLAFIMGVPWKDCGAVGELIGIKTFANEFIAYSRLAGVVHQLDERSTVIATYALCGFSNLGSIGICIGGLGAIAPRPQGRLGRAVLPSAGCRVGRLLPHCLCGRKSHSLNSSHVRRSF